MQKCPNCKIINSETAERCDCGYDFASRTTTESLPTGADAQQDGMDADPALVATRREHLRAEAYVKGFGDLLVWTTILGSLRMLRAPAEITAIDVGSQIVALISGLLLRNFDATGRWLYTLLVAGPSVAWSLIALMQISSDTPPLFLVISLLGILWPAVMLPILWSRKGRMVTSAHYTHVMAMTPELKPGTPVWLVVLFLLSIVLIVAAAVASV